MGSVVFCLDGQRQSLDGPEVQAGDLLGMPLFRFQFAQIEAVRPENDIYHRQAQEARLPAQTMVGQTDEGRNRAPYQVVGKRPEVALIPNPTKLFASSKGDYSGY